MSYSINFIEEFWGQIKPEYKNHAFGRVEIYDNEGDNPYAIEEIRFFTSNRDGFYEFREKWDFEDISEKQLDALRQELEDKWHEKVEGE